MALELKALRTELELLRKTYVAAEAQRIRLHARTQNQRRELRRLNRKQRSRNAAEPVVVTVNGILPGSIPEGFPIDA